ncbi:MAG: DUF3592 domain-containing protein [Oligoflexia bacterium]|nr:DUF3592 domain-containing protein [Oligoflexia bacterium]
MRTKTLNPFSGVFFGLIFALIGSALVYYKAWPEYQNAKESLKWPTTEGVILNSEITESKDKKNHRVYKPHISFSFEISGKQYTSAQIYIGSETSSSGSHSEANVYIRKYPVGKKVMVYYSPTENGEALLEPGTKTGHYLLLGIGALFGLVGFGITLSSLLKIAVLATMLGVVVGAFFGKSKEDHRPTPQAPSSNNPSDYRKKISAVEKKLSSSNHNEGVQKGNNNCEINLDEEMSTFNKVSATNILPQDEPWKYQWIIKGEDKDYGPYTFEKVVDFFNQGKVKGQHRCSPASGGEIVNISTIVKKKAS